MKSRVAGLGVIGVHGAILYEYSNMIMHRCKVMRADTRKISHFHELLILAITNRDVENTNG